MKSTIPFFFFSVLSLIWLESYTPQHSASVCVTHYSSYDTNETWSYHAISPITLILLVQQTSIVLWHLHRPHVLNGSWKLLLFFPLLLLMLDELFELHCVLIVIKQCFWGLHIRFLLCWCFLSFYLSTNIVFAFCTSHEAT
jgi:hypothetical protein